MPRPFHFSLQKVLDYREQLEEQAKMELAQAQQVYARQVEKAQALRQALQQHGSSLYAGGKAPTPSEIWLWERYRERLTQDLREAEQKALQLAQNVAKKQRQLIARAKDRKLLDKLRTNKQLRHISEEERLEQKEFDEMATVRYQPPHY